MITWFTADTHVGHANVIRYSRRPFDSAQAMDAALVEHWNQAIRPNDKIFHLGDFTLAGPVAVRQLAPVRPFPREPADPEKQPGCGG